MMTNHRVVDTNFSGLLHFKSSEARLDSIENVTHSQKGTWQLLFNYGDVEIKTAAAGIADQGTLTFDNIPQPARVADILTDLLPRHKGHARPADSAASASSTSTSPTFTSGKTEDIAQQATTYKVMTGDNQTKYKKAKGKKP